VPTIVAHCYLLSNLNDAPSKWSKSSLPLLTCRPTIFLTGRATIACGTTSTLRLPIGSIIMIVRSKCHGCPLTNLDNGIAAKTVPVETVRRRTPVVPRYHLASEGDPELAVGLTGVSNSIPRVLGSRIFRYALTQGKLLCAVLAPGLPQTSFEVCWSFASATVCVGDSVR
jgi:hypothetical protein